MDDQFSTPFFASLLAACVTTASIVVAAGIIAGKGQGQILHRVTEESVR